jgi:hypothetical protein
MPLFDFLIIGFDHYLFIQIVLYSVSKYKKVGVDFLELWASKKMFILLLIVIALLMLLFDLMVVRLEPRSQYLYMIFNCSIWLV